MPIPNPLPDLPAGWNDPPAIGRDGIYPDLDRAVAAAQRAFRSLDALTLEKRHGLIAAIRAAMRANAELLARMAHEETGLGRYEDKVQKNLLVIEKTPGPEILQPLAWTGDRGLALVERAPYGVFGVITPVTNPTSTIINNAIGLISAGNAAVFNVHPSARKVSTYQIQLINRAVVTAGGPTDLLTAPAEPTIASAQALMQHPGIRILLVTGGGAVVKLAMTSGKRAICAGPGNPPVLVDATADLERAARSVIQGGAYDNNLLCIGEKEIFVLEQVADKFMAALERAGAVRLNSGQLERLTKEAFTFAPGHGAGCPEPVVNKQLVGKDAAVLARIAGASVPEKTELLFAETDASHVFVLEEQMMPFVPVVRVSSVQEGILAAKTAEHNYRHTAIIHSHDVSNMTAMGRALDTTLFVKNGPCMAGLGLGGEGYLSYSIATPTGEGVTNPRTFTRVRRCVMVDNLRIY